MTNPSSQPVLESRAGPAAYVVPLGLTLGAVALLVAWIIMQAVGVDRAALNVWGLLALLGGLFGLTVAAAWTWGARRSGVVIADDELTVTPILAKSQTVRLSTLSRVGLRSAGGSARILELADGTGGTADVGLGVWKREAEILRLIALAARLSGATVDSGASRALGIGS